MTLEQDSINLRLERDCNDRSREEVQEVKEALVALRLRVKGSWVECSSVSSCA